jgi:hypothetical protein
MLEEAQDSPAHLAVFQPVVDKLPYKAGIVFQ